MHTIIDTKNIDLQYCSITLNINADRLNLGKPVIDFDNYNERTEYIVKQLVKQHRPLNIAQHKVDIIKCFSLVLLLLK